MKNNQFNTCLNVKLKFFLIGKLLLAVTLITASFFMNAEASSDDKILYWVAPMNPNFRSDQPGKSPMGMDLVPFYTSQNSDSNDGSSDNDERAIVSISPETIQNIGVRTERVELKRFGVDVRSYGTVSANLRQQVEIASRVSGWIEKLEITAVGDKVIKGQLLFMMYSPDLVSAQQDYIAALGTDLKGRIASSAKRLKSLGVQEKALELIKSKRRKLQNIPFYAEMDGVISKLNVKRGSYIKTGMQIAEIQDYSTVWINISIAEKDLIFLFEGMNAEVSFPNISNEVRIAKVDYVYPTIDKDSRTGKARLILDNNDGILRPGSYADVSFETSVIEHLAVSSEAVLRSSDGDYVVVALGNGRFQPKKVKTGVYNRGQVQILSGLNNGDKIVVSSQFLIDSESSLRGAFRKMKKVETQPAVSEGSAHEGK